MNTRLSLAFNYTFWIIASRFVYNEAMRISEIGQETIVSQNHGDKGEKSIFRRRADCSIVEHLLTDNFLIACRRNKLSNYISVGVIRLFEVFESKAVADNLKHHGLIGEVMIVKTPLVLSQVRSVPDSHPRLPRSSPFEEICGSSPDTAVKVSKQE